MATAASGLNKADYKAFYISEGGTVKVFHHLGTGVTAMDEQPNAQSETTIYINNKSGTTDTKSYDWKFPFTAEMFLEAGATEEAIKLIHDIPMMNKIGSGAVLELVIVNLYDPQDTPLGDVENKLFSARKFSVSVQVDNMGGAAGEKATMSGTLNGRGDPVWGEFDIETLTFTEA